MNVPKQIQKQKQITALLFLSLILTAVDIYTTYILHERGHVEWNPFMQSILTSLGPTTFLLINLTLSFLLIAFLAHASIKKLEGRYQYLPLLIYCVIRGSAVVNNLLILTNVL